VTVRRQLSTAVGGVVDGLELGGSGLGDAVVGWVQGPADRRRIAAAVVDAPPDPFAVQTPIEWVRRGRAVTLRWDEPPHAIGGVSYAVTVDDDTVAEGLGGTRRRVPLRRLDDGVAVVQVVAEDPAGQETTSFPAELKIDRRRPRVRVSGMPGSRVRVVLRDGPRRNVSGVAPRSVRVDWGDGRSSEGRAKLVHRYRVGGRRRLVVKARDRAGNRVNRFWWVTP
jgi:hypothetical protein